MIGAQSLVFAVEAQCLRAGSSFEVTPLRPESPELWYSELPSGLIQVEDSIFGSGYASEQYLPSWATASLMLT